MRLIAATNKNLAKLVREGKFRDDLYFRLNVVHITMPPLRERKEDIPLLVRGFLRHFCKANEKPLLDLTADAMNALLTYDWPGNVRELRTAIEHGVVMAHGPKMTLRDLPANVRAGGRRGIARRHHSRRSFRGKSEPARSARNREALDHAGAGGDKGQHHAAAKKLGISRRTLHRKINEMNREKAQTESRPGKLSETTVIRMNLHFRICAAFHFLHARRR